MKPLAFLLQLTFIVSLDSSVWAQTQAAVSQVPSEVMNAEFISVTGSSPIRLGVHKGGVIVVALWASWCGPCRSVIIALNGVNKDFAMRGVEVVGLTTEDPAKDGDEVNAFLNKSKVNLPVAWLKAEYAKILMGGRDAIPQILVLADDGTVAKRLVGWNQEHTMRQLREAIEEALTKAAPK